MKMMMVQKGWYKTSNFRYDVKFNGDAWVATDLRTGSVVCSSNKFKTVKSWVLTLADNNE